MSKYKDKIVAEAQRLQEFTSAQMTKLKKEYEPLKGKRLPVGAIDKMNIMLKKYSTDMLMKLAKGGIAFLSTAAKSELVINRGKKWTDFKEPLDMAEADELQQEACWVGYKQVGMKKKGNRQVPNCVKEELVESKMQVQNLKTLPHRTAFRATIKKVLPSVVAYGSDSNPDFLTFVGSKSDLESLATMAKQYKVGPIRESMDDDCPTCNGGECQCATPEVGKVHECCGNEECICDSLEEALKVKYDKTKQGWFDDKGRRRYLGNAATNAIMKKKLDHAIKTGDWTSFDVNVNEIIEAHQGQGLPPHLAKLFDKDGNFKDPKTQKKYQDMIDRQGKKNFKITDVTPKGYGPKEDLDSKDKETIEPIIKQLKKAVTAHGDQAKQLQKDIKDETDLKEYGSMNAEMMKKEMMKKMEMMKAEADPEKMEMMRKEMMKEMDKMPEMMKKEMMKKMEMAMKEGFASDAQRKAAFASGYKEKGKKKKEEVSEAMKPQEMAVNAMAMNAMKMNAMKMPIRAMYKKEMKTGDDDMQPMSSMKMNAMTDPKKMNAMTMQDPKQDMAAGYMKSDVRAAVKDGGGKDMAKVKDKPEMMTAMKKINAMYKKESTNKRYLQTKPGSLEEAVLISRGLVKEAVTKYDITMSDASFFKGNDLMKAMNQTKKDGNSQKALDDLTMLNGGDDVTLTFTASNPSEAVRNAEKAILNFRNKFTKNDRNAYTNFNSIQLQDSVPGLTKNDDNILKNIFKKYDS